MDYLDFIIKIVAASIASGVTLYVVIKFHINKTRNQQKNIGNNTASQGGYVFSNVSAPINIQVTGNPDSSIVKLTEEAEKILRSIPPDSSLVFHTQEHKLCSFSDSRKEREIQYSNDSAINDALEELVEHNFLTPNFCSQNIRTYKITSDGKRFLYRQKV